MKAIIVNHNKIYGSIGLYIPLSLDFRNYFFPFVIFTVISNGLGERKRMILFLVIIITLDRGAWLRDRLGTHSRLLFLCSCYLFNSIKVSLLHSQYLRYFVFWFCTSSSSAQQIVLVSVSSRMTKNLIHVLFIFIILFSGR